jgi:hypothetical protein
VLGMCDVQSLIPDVKKQNKTKKLTKQKKKRKEKAKPEQNTETSKYRVQE